MTEITFEYYCLLGGAANPKCHSRAFYLGRHFMHMTYWMED